MTAMWVNQRGKQTLNNHENSMIVFIIILFTEN